MLRKSDGVNVVLNASATHVGLDEAGSAIDSVTPATLDGRRIDVRARRFVLACGGLENARLLLACRDRAPGGIANDHDAVGRFFMDHPRAVYGKVHVAPGTQFPLLRGRPLADGKYQMGVGLSARTQAREQLLNHYATFELQTSGYAEAQCQSFVQTMKVVLRRGYAGNRLDFARRHITDIPDLIYLLSPKELMPHWFYRAHFLLREALPRRPTPRTFIAVCFCEQPARSSSPVTLGDPVDRLGMPRMRLNWDIGDAARDSPLRMHALFGSELQRTGVGRLETPPDGPVFTDASHHMGTTRMSSGPRTGVVDAECRVHGVRNLFVAGSSVFRRAGHANPTLTVVALAARLAAKD